MVRDVLASFGVESVEDDAGPKINGDAGNLYARIPATAPGTPIDLPDVTAGPNPRFCPLTVK